ncbi:MAG: SRPBCC family protein [Planctomycetota bacterium]|jgi:uncharacterized protein YndB with AHSA1/START domain
MVKREDDGIWVILRETIAAHHEEVFACLTTPNGLSRWFPVAAKVDLCTGGKIVFGWNKDFTRATTVAILDYDPGGRIVWDWHAGQHETHAPVYWQVEPSVEEGCRVVLRQGPFKDDVESLIAMAEEAESWRWQLCNLRAALEVSHDMRKVRPL